MNENLNRIDSQGKRLNYIIETEHKIMRRVIKALLGAGYELSVFDSEEVTLKRSTDAKAIFEALRTTDDDYLFVHKPGEKGRIGWVRFVYGNDGWDVVCDYTVNLEDVLAPVNEYANTLEVR